MKLRVLITGCSGGGKSTLLAAMASRGWETVPEPGRRVIDAERAGGGDGFPWSNPDRFARLCLAMAQTDWREAADGITLYDRGVPDAALALTRMGHTTHWHAHPYSLIVLAPPWPEVFVHDADRRHGMDAALEEYAHLAETFPDAVPLPKVDVPARVDWLEALIAKRYDTYG